MGNYFNETEVRKAINILKPDNQLFEVRIIGSNKSKAISGYFKSTDNLITALKQQDLKGCNVYFTLGVIKEGCYAREQCEKFLIYQQTTGNNDIERYQWMLIDLDPNRPTGISSSEEELKAAGEVAKKMLPYLRSLGFRDPLKAKSGNGYHLLYRIDLENTKENVQLVEGCLKALAGKFSTDKIGVDTSVSNPGRICKLYGTLAQKGGNTEDRPHRMSKLYPLESGEVEITPREILQKLADTLPQDQQKTQPAAKNRPAQAALNRGGNSDFDIRRWMQDHSIGYQELGKSGRDSSTIFALDECPFDSTHRNGDAKIFQYSDGAISFKCHHASCADRAWQDVRVMFEPDAYISTLDYHADPVPKHKKQSSADQGAEKSPFYDGNKFLHEKVAEYITEAHKVCLTKGTNKAVYATRDCNGHVYEVGEDVISSLVIKYAPHSTANQRREVYSYIKDSPSTPHKDSNDINPPPHLIPFKSKVYDIDKREFRDYADDDIFLTQYPFDYVPFNELTDAQKAADAAVRCIDEIADNDAEISQLILEAFGYCFITKNIYKKCFMFYGENGNNGKSTLLNILSQLVGVGNTSRLTPQDTEQKFRLPMVFGKAVNIGDDIPSTRLRDTSNFKKVASGQSITAERKNKDPFDFEPFCKCFFACNELPTTADKTDALFDRVIIIPLNHKFSGSSCNVNLQHRKWTDDEITHLLSWCMLQFEAVYHNSGQFTLPQPVKDIMRQYKIDNNTVLQYLDEIGGVQAILRKPTAEVHQDYLMFCARNGLQGFTSKNKVSKEINKACGTKSKSIPVGKNQNANCYVLPDPHKLS